METSIRTESHLHFNERPQLITLLCILSFVMSSVMILLAVVKLFDAESGLLTYLMMAVQCASLIGIVYMWKMQRLGFFIYVVAELIPWLLFFTMSDIGSVTSAFGFFLPAWVLSSYYLVLGTAIIIDVVFIALYAIKFRLMH